MDEEIRALRSELALLKLQFSERVATVEARLNKLIAQNAQQVLQADQQSRPFDEVQTSTLTPAHADVIENEQHTPKPTPTTIPENFLVAGCQLEAQQARSPSFLSTLFQTLLLAFFDWLSPIVKIYQSYKERGMLGIFVLTIVGLTLTLAGFGYLMQLLVDQLGAGAKSLLMCFAAILVIGLGIALKIKTRFGEFATAIVTLGVLLAYSTVYFSGSVYGLLPNILVLILYLVIALLCHALALWLDTKVIAALGIVGISTMPILSNTTTIEPIYYLLSLAFVVASSLNLAYRHVGPWLAHLTLAFTMISLEWMIGFDHILVPAWGADIFYLLFFTYVAVSLFTARTPTKPMLVFLAAAVGASVLILFQGAALFSGQMSLIFAFNALLAMAVSVLFYKLKRDVVAVFILLAATWGVLTIVSAISAAYWGIAWAAEGLLLIAIGRQYAITSAVNQGQTLTAIALVYSWSALAMYFPLPALKSMDGWLLSLMIVTIVATWQRLINTTEVFNQYTQGKIKPLLQLIEAIWLSILLISCANIWLGNWTGALIILVQIALLIRAKNCKQVSIEIFAAILFLVALFYAYQGALMVDSYRFTLLPLFAKLALLSAFVQLWLWSAYYRKFQADSPIKHIAEAARILFYLLIPVCWLGSVIRRFDEQALMLLWLSPLLALLLARRVNHPLLRKETQLLTALASLAFALGIGQLTLMNSAVVLVGFSSFYALAYLFNRKETTALNQFICSCALLSLGLAIPNIVAVQSASLFSGVVVATIYWAIAFNAISRSEHLKRNEKVITVVNLLLVLAAWILMTESVQYSLVPLLFLASARYQKQHRFYPSWLGKTLQPNADLYLHSIVAMTYLILFSSLIEYRLDLLIAPALAAHGALILFLKDKRLTTVKYSFGLILLAIIKLAMIDAANALLWQKVVLFIGIGVFILVASFWYQKLVSNAAPSANELEIS